MFFDTHAHYDDKAFDADRTALLNALHDQGVDLVINPGCDEDSSRAAAALAEELPFVYAAVGIHPEELASYSGSLESIRALSAHPKCVAIGEIGLDYYWDAEHKEEQKALFRQQIELALESGKPVIVHDREAHGDCLDIVRDYPELRGVFHCYSGSAEMARELVRLGWMISFTGVLTYKNARKAVEVAQSIPLERIVLETDCPYMSPEPFRGKRNDPSRLCYMAEKLAQLRSLPVERIHEITVENGKRLYRM